MAVRWPIVSETGSWGPAGMEADAHGRLESEGGLETGGLGVSARLRDIGRFGLFVLADGDAFNGKRVQRSVTHRV